jgi:hypothetical protein
MNWFFTWLRRRIQQTELLVDVPYANQTKSSVIGVGVRSIESASSINFTINKANGGYVVSYSVYDRRTDRHDQRLHIITEDKDLGEELGKIISFESLRG